MKPAIMLAYDDFIATSKLEYKPKKYELPRCTFHASNLKEYQAARKKLFEMLTTEYKRGKIKTDKLDNIYQRIKGLKRSYTARGAINYMNYRVEMNMLERMFFNELVNTFEQKHSLTRDTD